VTTRLVVATALAGGLLVLAPPAPASPLDRAGWSRPMRVGDIDVRAEPVINPSSDGQFVAAWAQGLRIANEPQVRPVLRTLGSVGLGEVRAVDLTSASEIPERIAAATAGNGTVVLIVCAEDTTRPSAPYRQDSVRTISLLPSGAFGSPTTLASGDESGEGLHGCDVAADANDAGQTALAWTSHSGGAEHMDVSVRGSDGTEIRREELAPPAGNGSLAVDLDDAGGVTVVWEPDVGGLYVASAPPDQPFTVRRLAAGLPESGRVDTDAYDTTPDGHQGLVWREGTYRKWVLRAATARSGQPFGSSQRIAGNGTDSPAIAVGRSGDVAVIWREHDGRLRAVQAPANGPFGHATTLSGPDPVDPDEETFGGEQRVTVTSDGTAIVAWRHASGRPASRITVAEGRRGTWRSMASYPAPNYFGIDLASDDSGHVVLTWERIALRGVRIEAAVRLSTGGFSHPIQVWPVLQYGNVGDRLDSPSTLIGVSGNALIWWKRDPGEGDERWEVSLRRFQDAQHHRREPPSRGSRRPRARSRR
jgi:hypothetical protein